MFWMNYQCKAVLILGLIAWSESKCDFNPLPASLFSHFIWCIIEKYLNSQMLFVSLLCIYVCTVCIYVGYVCRGCGGGGGGGGYNVGKKCRVCNKVQGCREGRRGSQG